MIGQRRRRPYLRAATLCLLGALADVALADALAQCGVHWMAAAFAGASAATLWCLWALLPEGPDGGRRALGLWPGGGAVETKGVQA
ncbi:hypothetical protein FGG78_36435 [Thioclava sp. BHET1]|nr:hypothetical protein FGG78_36435 [Thioclava sp. BHET1]